MQPTPIEFYRSVKQYVIGRGYQGDIDFYEKTRFESFSAINFLEQFTWVVLSTGMKNQVAQKMYDRLWSEGIGTVKYQKKKEAILAVHGRYEEHFEKIKSLPTVEEKIEYMYNLPFIGNITKYHLAKNIGIDCAKPDRHLERIAGYFGYSNVQKFCKEISDKMGDRVNVVDVVIWRYGNLEGTNSSAEEFFSRWEQVKGTIP